MQNQRHETERMNALIGDLRSEVASAQRKGETELAAMQDEMKGVSDNMIAMGSGEVLNIRQNADAEVTAARTQTRDYEHELQQLPDELNAGSPPAPDADSYTKLVCDLDQARTEVKYRQQHVGGLNTMMNLLEEQLDRERSGAGARHQSLSTTRRSKSLRM